MNKENLEQGLTKLLKTFYTKKYNRDFSDLTVVLDEYEEDADDMDDEGNWVSAESYYFKVSFSPQQLQSKGYYILCQDISSSSSMITTFLPIPLTLSRKISAAP